MKEKKIFYANCIESGYDLLKCLLEEGLDIHYIISLTHEQAMRNRVSGYKSFEPLSREYNIPIYYPVEYSMKTDEDAKFFISQKPHLMLVHGWQRLIPEEILDVIDHVWGDHGSSEPLPKGRGRSPINWCLVENRKKFLLHLLSLDKDVDSGEIVDIQEFDINEYDSCRTLYNKKVVSLKRMLLKSIPLLLEGKLETRTQIGDPSYYRKRTPQDGIIDWGKTTLEIYNLIRGVTVPYPGAFSYLDGREIYMWAGQPFDTKLTYPNKKEGEILEIFNDGSFVVKTRDSSILITEYGFLRSNIDIYREIDYINPQGNTLDHLPGRVDHSYKVDRDAFESIEKGIVLSRTP